MANGKSADLRHLWIDFTFQSFIHFLYSLEASPMTSPTLRQSLLVPHQLPSSTVSFPQFLLLTPPVCPQMPKQYCSVRLAQGVGGLH